MGVHENNQLIEVRKMSQTCGNIIIVDSITISRLFVLYLKIIFWSFKFLLWCVNFSFVVRVFCGIFCCVLLRAISSDLLYRLITSFNDPSLCVVSMWVFVCELRNVTLLSIWEPCGIPIIIVFKNSTQYNTNTTRRIKTQAYVELREITQKLLGCTNGFLGKTCLFV